MNEYHTPAIQGNVLLMGSISEVSMWANPKCRRTQNIKEGPAFVCAQQKLKK
jgi:hypothetical protein